MADGSAHEILTTTLAMDMCFQGTLTNPSIRYLDANDAPVFSIGSYYAIG